MRITKGYGFTVDDIDNSCFRDLEPYEKAHEQEQIEQDRLQHAWWGTYGLSATLVAVEHAVFGRKAQSEYIKSTVYENSMANRELTEEEKQREVDKFFRQEDARLENWKRKKARQRKED